MTPRPTPPGTVARPVINDHRDIIIAQVAYSLKDIQTLLGLSYDQVRGLVRGDNPKLRARITGKAYVVPGAALIDYLNGFDEPMRHPESA